MNYDTLVSNLQNLLVIPVDDSSFTSILPALIADAEGRIYREMDFLTTRGTDSSLSFTANSRSITTPATMIIFEGLSVITPAAIAPSAGTRNVCARTTIDYIDFVWPQETGLTGVPEYFGMLNDTTAIVAPTPDAAYRAEFTGIIRPTPISDSNQNTWLSTNLPDLLLAACMVFGAAYLRDFGSQVADPQIGVSWEGHYQTLKQSAIEEEQRRKAQGMNWGPYSTTPYSTPRTG